MVAGIHQQELLGACHALRRTQVFHYPQGAAGGLELKFIKYWTPKLLIDAPRASKLGMYRNTFLSSGRSRTGTLIVLSYIYVTYFLLCIDCFICDFSEFGNIYEEKRSRPLPETGEKLLFLHHNLKLF